MDQLFLAIQTRLQDVTELKWVDFDFGQLDAYDLRPPVQFPCALIDIELPETRDQGPGAQFCRCTVTIRIAFEQPGQTHNKAPQHIREKALVIYTVLKNVHACMHGHQPPGFSKILRRGMATERRQDPLKVFSIRFETSFVEKVEKEWVEMQVTPVIDLQIEG